MQIALTKKLVDAASVSVAQKVTEVNPLFVWTANWTNVWSDCEEDTLVLVNNATRFAVAVYQVERKDLKNMQTIMLDAIRHTMQAFNINPEVIDDYFRLAGPMQFVRNTDRKATAWVNRAGLESVFYIGQKYDGHDEVFDDTLGIKASRYPCHSSNSKECLWPYKLMKEQLAGLTGKPVYNYRAFELTARLDLEAYIAERRVIVPADTSFAKLHEIIQRVYDWKNRHLYNFVVYSDSGEEVVRLTPGEERLGFDDKEILMGDHKLSEYLPENRRFVYTYDMGDNWQHEIEVTRVIENYDQESPYLLSAEGKTPPEDVGGVPGFLEFRDIMAQPKHPEYQQYRQWAEYWTFELSEWEKRPRVIQI